MLSWILSIAFVSFFLRSLGFSRKLGFLETSALNRGDTTEFTFNKGLGLPLEIFADPEPTPKVTYPEALGLRHLALDGLPIDLKDIKMRFFHVTLNRSAIFIESLIKITLLSYKESNVMFWNVLFIIISSFFGLMVVAGIIAAIQKKNTVYGDSPTEKNPMEGKAVRFIISDEDPENADGVRGHLEVIGERSPKSGFYSTVVKRALDIVLSFGGLLILSPLLLGLIVAIKIDDPGPAFFTQKRVGKNKKYFKLHKFRSMKVSTPHEVPTHMLKNPDQYITKVGRFIRAHSLDELPQIWDIFIGNMSIVGPRPALWNQDVLTAERDLYGANDVCPGLTGWAQINGRDEISIEEKAKMDGDYSQNLSFSFDCRCFFASIHVVAKDDTVAEGGKKENGTEKKETSSR